VLVEASLRYGIPEAKLSKIVEREPNWWSRFMENLQPYRVALQAAFCQIAVTEGQENLVYHGHLGHELLPDYKHVLKVLLTAPMERRIEQVKARQGLSDAAARKFIDETDKARSRRLMGMFGVDWCDASRFDLVVNLGRMSVNTIKHLILETLTAAGLPDHARFETGVRRFRFGISGQGGAGNVDGRHADSSGRQSLGWQCRSLRLGSQLGFGGDPGDKNQNYSWCQRRAHGHCQCAGSRGGRLAVIDLG
jgi:hypothetical protein